MRTICDVCEGAPATIFCAADEAALCKACDEKVHKCNKLASRHFRVGLADPSEVPHCDICENAPAFFYCEIDGSSLCLQCDMNVHVGGKRTHERYLLLRQKIEFPRDKPAGFEDGTLQRIRTENHRENNHVMRKTMDEQMQNRIPSAAGEGNADNIGNADSNMIDLNSRPQRAHGQASNLQVLRPDIGSSNGNNGASRLPLGPFTREQEK